MPSAQGCAICNAHGIVRVANAAGARDVLRTMRR